MKILAVIHYIMNYVLKGNYGQYQRIMSAAIIQKVYEDVQAKTTATNTPVRYADLDKFALQTFNRLVYEQEVSRLLLALCLLSFLNYYSHNIKLRHINLNLIYCYFTNIIFYKSSIL